MVRYKNNVSQFLTYQKKNAQHRRISAVPATRKNSKSRPIASEEVKNQLSN